MNSTLSWVQLDAKHVGVGCSANSGLGAAVSHLVATGRKTMLQRRSQLCAVNNYISLGAAESQLGASRCKGLRPARKLAKKIL